MMPDHRPPKHVLLRQIAADMRSIAAAAQARPFHQEAIIALLRGIAADMWTLRAAVDPNVAAVAELLRVIAGAFGDAPFTTSELIARADAPPWPWNNSRKLGKLFRRIEGRDFEGLHVQRLGDEAAGAIWVCKS